MRGPVAREDGQPARAVQLRCGQRRVQGARRHPACARADLRPAQTVQVLGTEDEVHAASQRIAVDEQRTVAAARRPHGRRDRQHRRTRPAPAADDGEHRAVAAFALRGLRQRRDQPGFGLR